MSKQALRFGLNAEQYDFARPSYHPDFAAALAGVSPAGYESSVLESGAGTGKASMSLARSFKSVHLVEPDPEMARVLRRSVEAYGNCSVMVERLEAFQSSEPFDVVLAAQSWHWVEDPRVERVVGLLTPDGVVAVLNNRLLWDGSADLRGALDSCYERLGIGLSVRARHGPAALLQDNALVVEELALSPLLEPPTVQCWMWSQEVSVEGYISLLSTESEHLSLAEDIRGELFGAVRSVLSATPSIELSWLTSLITSRRSK